jgi:hypothetical protein
LYREDLHNLTILHRVSSPITGCTGSTTFLEGQPKHKTPLDLPDKSRIPKYYHDQIFTHVIIIALAVTWHPQVEYLPVNYHCGPWVPLNGSSTKMVLSKRKHDTNYIIIRSEELIRFRISLGTSGLEMRDPHQGCLKKVTMPTCTSIIPRPY